MAAEAAAAAAAGAAQPLLMRHRSAISGGRSSAGRETEQILESLQGGGGGGGGGAFGAAMASHSRLVTGTLRRVPSIGEVLSRVPSFGTLLARSASVGGLGGLSGLGLGLRSAPSAETLLALVHPVDSITRRFLTALPADLSGVLADACDVVFATICDRGNRRTAERQIRAVLAVLTSLLSHVSRSLLFSWSGRRKLLGGLAALDSMLEMDAANEGGVNKAAFRRFGSVANSFPAAPRLPRLLRLLAARERAYGAKLSAWAQPIGRHKTGSGRCTARDPFSFGFHGSIVLDEEAEKARRLQRKAGNGAGAGVPPGNGREAAAAQPQQPQQQQQQPDASPWWWWPFAATAQSAPTDLLQECDVPVALLFEVGATANRRGSLSAGGLTSYDGRADELSPRRPGRLGSHVRVLRHPPSWTAIPPRSRTSAAEAPASAGAATTTNALMFYATVIRVDKAAQTADLEYKNVCIEPRFGEGCDGARLNVLLPELSLSIEGLVCDLIDRGASVASADLISARWTEPSAADSPSSTAPPAAATAEGSPRDRSCSELPGELLGTLDLSVAKPILFHVVAEAARIVVLGKGALFALNHLIGTRTNVQIEADVELTHLTYRLKFRQDGIYFCIANLKMQFARDGDLRCRSAEGGFVEWLLRAIPAQVLEWIETALKENLRKDQLLCQWQGDTEALGALDGLFREIERLEWLKQEACRRYGSDFGQSLTPDAA